MRFDNLLDLKRYLKQQDQAKLQKQFVIQESLDGDDVSLCILSRNGMILAATFQRGLIENTREYGPMGAVEFVKDDMFMLTAQKLAACLGWNGWACLDSIWDSHGDLRITDMNARFWNSLLGSMEAGISFPYLACLAALDVEFPVPDYELVRYFHPMTFFREEFLSIYRRSREHNITFRESGLKFLVTDPLTEAIRIYNNHR